MRKRSRRSTSPAFFTDDDLTDSLTFDAGSTLPPGLTIDPATGIISGTINADASTTGPYDVTITATDNAGDSITQRFTWTVNNLAPTATNNTGTVTEDATLTDTGNLISDDDGNGFDTDPDNDALSIAEVNGSSVTGSSSIAGSYGTLTVNSNGDYSYTVNNALNAVQALASGESIVDSFSYQLTDSQGGTDTAQLNITIQGANDTPETVGTIT